MFRRQYWSLLTSAATAFCDRLCFVKPGEHNASMSRVDGRSSRQWVFGGNPFHAVIAGDGDGFERRINPEK